jgi:hypothetical protein
MTTDELRRYFSDGFGLQPWPATFKVTAETYGNVCHSVFKHELEKGQVVVWDVVKDGVQQRDFCVLPISVGTNGGIMFKGVELIVENYDNPLQHELLDLITLMPDSQTQELIDYILDLRRIRSERDTKS